MAQFKKVIVAGSRTFNTEADYGQLQAKMDELILEHGLPDEIVSGGARGPDRFGERYASENQLAVTRFIPDWDRYSKKAGMLRNKDMGNYADTLVAFWDGRSKGTRHMIEYAYKIGLDVVLVLIPYKNNNDGSGTLPVSE
jgi:hypothetical protein